MNQKNEYQISSVREILHETVLFFTIVAGMYFISVNVILSIILGVVIVAVCRGLGIVSFIIERGTARFVGALFGMFFIPVIYRYVTFYHSSLWVLLPLILFFVIAILFVQSKHRKWNYDALYTLFLTIGYLVGTVGIVFGVLTLKAFMEWQ